jgi:hypothetical protein
VFLDDVQRVLTCKRRKIKKVPPFRSERESEGTVGGEEEMEFEPLRF